MVGFFNTYRQLYPVSRHVLRDIADQFQRWLKGWSEKRNIPVADAPKGRRDDFVDPYFKGADLDAVVIILKAREPARIMTAIGDSKANRWHLQIANRWVVQYNFYINDPQWGRCLSASVPTCRSPPASASISIIGWPSACVRRASTSSNVPMPSRDALSPNASSNSPKSPTPWDSVALRPKVAGAPHAILYRQGEAGIRLPASIILPPQVEYCDNLIFRRRTALDKLGERLLDANRTIGQPNKITVIFGRRISKHYRGKLQTEIEDMDLPSPVIFAATMAMASSSSTFAITSCCAPRRRATTSTTTA